MAHFSTGHEIRPLEVFERDRNFRIVQISGVGAANGQAAAEVSAVLLGMAGQEPLEPAAAKLLAASQGADLAWGLVAGCRAALLLSVS